MSVSIDSFTKPVELHQEMQKKSYESLIQFSEFRISDPLISKANRDINWVQMSVFFFHGTEERLHTRAEEGEAFS